MELRHGMIGVLAGGDELLVALLELLGLLGRVGERLGDADTGDGALQRGVDPGDGLAAAHEGVAHAAAQAERHEQQQRCAAEYDQRQPDVDGGQVDERRDDADGADDEVLRAVVGQLGDVHQVVGHAGHDLARLVVVIEGIGQLLQVVEHIPPHLRLDVHAHHVALILDEVVQPHLDGVQRQHQQAGQYDELILAVGDQVVEHGAGDDGVEDADDRHQQRRPHVQRKDELMGLVVRHKALEQFHLVTPCSVGPCVCLRGAPAAPSGR